MAFGIMTLSTMTPNYLPSVITLSVTIKSFMLNVIVLNVIILNVVAPFLKLSNKKRIFQGLRKLFVENGANIHLELRTMREQLKNVSQTG
jgi:hypothetical protein